MNDSSNDISQDAWPARVRATGRQQRLDEWEGFWECLVEGAFVLVDRFDAHGRHFLVARRVLHDRRTLTEQERRVVEHAGLGYCNKEIACAVGLSTSTVGIYLSSARAKLGVASRTELVRLLRAVRPAPG